MSIWRKIQNVFTILFLLFAMYGCLTGKIVKAKETCKRPSWKTIYLQELECNMRYNHYILYLTNIASPEETIITRKNNYCKITKGKWIVNRKKKTITITDPTLLNIDHIYPVSEIVKNTGCKTLKKYYFYKENLQPMLASENREKSNTLCKNKMYCLKQYVSCMKMQDEIADGLQQDLKCYELFNLID